MCHSMIHERRYSQVMAIRALGVGVGQLVRQSIIVAEGGGCVCRLQTPLSLDTA